MKLKSLRVQNFRSLQTLEIDLPQVCAIVGPNNSGKSNILEAMRRVLAPEYGPRARDFTEDDVYLRDEKLDIEIECTFDPPLEYKKLKKADPVQIERLRFVYDRYQIGPQAVNRRLDQSVLNADGEKPTVMTSYGGKGRQPRFEPVLGIPQDLRDTVPLIYIGTDRSLKRQLPSAQYSLLHRIFEGINERLHDPSQTVTVKDADGNDKHVPRIARFQYLINRALNLLRTDEFDKLEAAIKKNALEQLGLDADTDAIDLFFTPLSTMDFYKSLDIIIKDHGFSISATEVGEGFQNAIVLAVLRAFEETHRSGAIVLIEEPEMFLHPQMQRSLYKTLRKIGEINQVIYTTHSPHFVSVPEYKDLLLVRRDEDGTYVVQSSLADDAKRREKFLKELDPERSELFFASRLLLVEGDTEKLALPEMRKRSKATLTELARLLSKWEANGISRTSPISQSLWRYPPASSTTKTALIFRKAKRPRRKSIIRRLTLSQTRTSVYGALITSSKMLSEKRPVKINIRHSATGIPVTQKSCVKGLSLRTVTCLFPTSSSKFLIGSRRRQERMTSNKLGTRFITMS